jgi:hypothetical protein
MFNELFEEEYGTEALEDLKEALRDDDAGENDTEEDDTVKTDNNDEVVDTIEDRDSGEKEKGKKEGKDTETQ